MRSGVTEYVNKSAKIEPRASLPPHPERKHQIGVNLVEKEKLLTFVKHACKDFGIWIECIECKKWRKDFHYSESHEVPESWCCSMLNLENGKKGSCDDPEEETEEEYLEYCPGSVVWAKLDGYPWWPAMVDENPDVEEFVWKEGKVRCCYKTYDQAHLLNKSLQL
ncbi:zinc finger CW-type PWWP domain protein 1 [Nephila pilipes]|uniref:Zinc finger CW-type PWWP domain protein 1 n=1 Tax=Nephila pilipes TaxID=299642 RepID=A0A8X6QG88_NEPPI|nr:zinc finger CW-type PWWP domain protein 1 [Nephila pilipes]